MAYDGIVISSVINEIKEACLGGRVVKVQQPETDIISITIKGFKGQTKLYMSVNASLPIVYVADSLPPGPVQAPAFCMLLRKHIGNGRLKDIKQPGFDRIYDFVFEHLDEMGDMCERHLIVEIMGRQSNIILADSDYMIMDCLRRVMPDLSEAMAQNKETSVRILFPGQKYTLPDSQGKLNPLSEEVDDRDNLSKIFEGKSGPISKLIYTSLSGFSKGIAEDIADGAGIDPRAGFNDLSPLEKDRLIDTIYRVIDCVKSGEYSPYIKYVDSMPKDFHAINISFLRQDNILKSENALDNESIIDSDLGSDSDSEKVSMSKVLINYYSSKEKTINIHSKSEDIRRVLKTAIERVSKKYDLQLQQLKDTEDRDIYRIYGELLNTYGYSLKGGEKSFTCLNYYDNEEITIPLDENLSASENSQKYFAKYNKKKRTNTALTEFVAKTKEELDYLLSVKHNLELAETETDVTEIRRELSLAGYIRKTSQKKKEKKVEAGEPLHFLSSDGYDIYIGKNNIQNDYLSFEFASGRDLWFHAKQMPGSHVIVKLKSSDTGLKSVPDRVFEEAASLAAYYSSGRQAPKVEIDYTERKNLKKPPQAKPGYVIYHTNYSMMAEPKEKI
ncbi:MAG: NFACT family protein [Eubacterium sp.]|nr:NFACT family protein [Eubacterium sp.]